MVLLAACSTVSRTPLARPGGQRPVCEETGAGYGVAAGLFLGGATLGAASDEEEQEHCEFCLDLPSGGEVLGAAMVIAAIPVLIYAIRNSGAQSACEATLARDYPPGPMPASPPPGAYGQPASVPPGPRGEITW